MKANSVPSCIRSENYIITFEVEEEKYKTSHTPYKVVFSLQIMLSQMPMIARFPFFGKKYQIKFANEITSETHCLVHFASLIRLAFLLDSFILFCLSLLSMPHVDMILKNIKSGWPEMQVQTMWRYRTWLSSMMITGIFSLLFLVLSFLSFFFVCKHFLRI